MLTENMGISYTSPKDIVQHKNVRRAHIIDSIKNEANKSSGKETPSSCSTCEMSFNNKGSAEIKEMKSFTASDIFKTWITV